MKYAEIRPQLKTGDIVLFSGTGFISTIIKLATGSKWSHCGMVLDLPEFDFKVLWESTSISETEDLDGELTKGVQLQQLSTRIREYDGEVAIRQLSHPLHEPNNKLKELRTRLKDAPYEKSEAELLKSALDPLFDNTQDLSSVFCSELVAEAYKELGLIGEDVPSNEYTPKDFATISTFRTNSLRSPIPVTA